MAKESLDIAKLVAIANLRTKSIKSYKRYLKSKTPNELQTTIQRKKCILKANTYGKVKKPTKDCMLSKRY